MQCFHWEKHLSTHTVLSVAGFPSRKVAQLLKPAPVHNNEPQDVLEIIDMQIIMTANKTRKT